MIRTISTPEGTFFYSRADGTCMFTDTKKSVQWQKPLYAQIALTTKCNLNCWHCYNNQPTSDCEWSIDKLKELVAYLDGWGIFGVALGGGEPFLYPYLCEVAEFVWEQTGLDVSLTTNGYAAKMEQLKVLEGRVGEVRVSVRGVGDCAQLLKFIGHRFEVGVNLMLYKGNAGFLEHYFITILLCALTIASVFVRLSDIFVQLFLLLFAVILHEIGHYVILRALGLSASLHLGLFVSVKLRTVDELKINNKYRILILLNGFFFSQIAVLLNVLLLHDLATATLLVLFTLGLSTRDIVSIWRIIH